jgi:arsenite-transporting ATPase
VSGARVLLFTGKGGVGKTTTAAATALDLAERGHRVVVTSADPAHSLSDALGVPLGSEPSEVAPRCAAQQLDALERTASSWGEIRSWLVEVFDWAGLSAVESEELAVFPGFEELVALMEIERLVGAGEHDVVVVDCAPTAETIRLLSLPDVLDWYMRRLFPASRRLTRVVGPVLSRLTDLPVARGEVFDAADRFHRQLARVRDLLTDPATTSARIVVTPERMVVAEGRRTLSYLSLFGYHVDAVVVNRILPRDGDDPFLAGWRASQSEQLDALRAGFEPLPLVHAPLGSSEILGIDALAAHGRGIWEGRDPLADLSPGRPMRLEHRGHVPVLVLSLPHVEGGDLDLVESDGDLAVSVGPYRRNLVLPASLRGRAVQRARLADGELEIHFGELPTLHATAGSGPGDAP